MNKLILKHKTVPIIKSNSLTHSLEMDVIVIVHVEKKVCLHNFRSQNKSGNIYFKYLEWWHLDNDRGSDLFVGTYTINLRRMYILSTLQEWLICWILFVCEWGWLTILHQYIIAMIPSPWQWWPFYVYLN